MQWWEKGRGAEKNIWSYRNISYIYLRRTHTQTLGNATTAQRSNFTFLVRWSSQQGEEQSHWPQWLHTLYLWQTGASSLRPKQNTRSASMRQVQLWNTPKSARRSEASAQVTWSLTGHCRGAARASAEGRGSPRPLSAPRRAPARQAGGPNAAHPATAAAAPVELRDGLPTTLPGPAMTQRGFAPEGRHAELLREETDRRQSLLWSPWVDKPS